MVVVDEAHHLTRPGSGVPSRRVARRPTRTACSSSPRPPSSSARRVISNGSGSSTPNAIRAYGAIRKDRTRYRAVAAHCDPDSSTGRTLTVEGSERPGRDSSESGQATRAASTKSSIRRRNRPRSASRRARRPAWPGPRHVSERPLGSGAVPGAEARPVETRMAPGPRELACGPSSRRSSLSDAGRKRSPTTRTSSTRARSGSPAFCAKSRPRKCSSSAASRKR